MIGSNKQNAAGRKLPRKLLALAAAAALLTAGGLGAARLLRGGRQDTQYVTDTVTRDTLESTVRGTGAAAARESVSLTPPVSTTVLALHVKEGDRVEAGTVLYELDPSEAQAATEEARKALADAEAGISSADERLGAARKQLAEAEAAYGKLQASRADLTVTAPMDGKLLEAAPLAAGTEIAAGQKVATVVSAGRLQLSLYFSYAYLDQLKQGQTATVSIPAAMTSVPGVVREIHQVDYVTPEGARCFEAVVALDNPGTLTAGMEATASLMAGGSPVYPYRSGTLAYQEVRDVTAKVAGPLQSSSLRSHAAVRAGQALLVLGPDALDRQLEEQKTAVDAARDGVRSAESSAETAREALTAAREKVKKAQEQEAAMCVRAPIAGTILTCLLEQGARADAGQLGILLADTSVMRVEIQVDERNVNRVKNGMACTVTQAGLAGEETTFEGTVESVSLTGKAENGVSFFPAVVRVDNGDGAMMTGMSVEYTLVLARSEDCLVVPAQAVQYTDQGTCLFVRADHRPDNAVDLGESADIPRGFYAVPVKTGLSDSERVEILSGVDEGAEVFTQRLTESGSSFDEV